MNTEKKSSQISKEASNSRETRLLNFFNNSSNRLIRKDFIEKENNSEKLSLDSLKKEIIYKLTSYSQEGRNVQFSEGIEEIENDNKDDNEETENFFMKISNKKKYSTPRTPPRNMKSSYKKTKEHIKTPYKTTKSRSSWNRSKNTKDSNICFKSNISTKCSCYWKSLLDNENNILKNFSQGQENEINRICNSVILDNPYANQKEYKNIFYNNSLEDSEEELNKSY